MWMMKPVAAIAALCLVAACGNGSPDTDPADVDGAEPVASETAAKVKGPALWKTGDEDTTIYLFGTVHVLPADLEWRMPAVDDALAAASTVYFETDIDPNPIELTRIVSTLGLYPRGEKLTDHLSPAQVEQLSSASDTLGVSVALLDSMRPWLAALTLAERTIVEAGYDPNSGVERTLAPIATAGEKDIRKFETIEQQLRIFADMPEATQIDYLMDGLEEIDEEPTLLHELVAAWANGDVETLADIMIREELADTPEIYKALLVDRNRNWADALEELTESEAGTFFVAVGAAHLAGDDSVVKMMADRGYPSTRVE